MYFLIKNPEAMRKAQAEVDNELGDQQLQMEDLNNFPYLTGKRFQSCRQMVIYLTHALHE